MIHFTNENIQEIALTNHEKEFFSTFSEKHYPVSTSEIDSRNINHLDKAGFLYDTREDDKSWRRLNLKELALLEIIKIAGKRYGMEYTQFQELASCFLPITRDRKGETIEPNDIEGDMALAMVMFGHAVMIVIDDRGKVGFYDIENYKMRMPDIRSQDSFLTLDFNEIVLKIIKRLYDYKSDLGAVKLFTNNINKYKKEVENSINLFKHPFEL